jgi:hypothetical protein
MAMELYTVKSLGADKKFIALEVIPDILELAVHKEFIFQFVENMVNMVNIEYIEYMEYIEKRGSGFILEERLINTKLKRT